MNDELAQYTALGARVKLASALELPSLDVLSNPKARPSADELIEKIDIALNHLSCSAELKN